MQKIIIGKDNLVNGIIYLQTVCLIRSYYLNIYKDLIHSIIKKVTWIENLNAHFLKEDSDQKANQKMNDIINHH